MQIFPPIDPDAERVLSLNANLALAPNEVLVGPITISVIVTAGDDTNPAGILNGPPSYDQTGTFILQPVANMHLLDGNDYEIEGIAATTTPDKNVVIRGLLQVRSGA